jgi:hypothetical protein
LRLSFHNPETLTKSSAPLSILLGTDELYLNSVEVLNILCGSELPQKITDSISGSYYKLKDGSVKPPELYLGVDDKKWYIHGLTRTRRIK